MDMVSWCVKRPRFKVVPMPENEQDIEAKGGHQMESLGKLT